MKLLKSFATALALAVSGLLMGSFATSAQAAYTAPYVPPGCVMVTNSGTNYPYPYKASSTSTTTGWYVYCGADATRFQYYAGKNFVDLPNGVNTSFMRDKFQNYGFTLYVFTSAAQAQSLLGANAIPAITQTPGVGGITQPVISPATTPFIAIWEQVVPVGGGNPAEYASNYDFLEVESHETGHGVDTIATTAGSGSTTQNSFRPRMSTDISIFNAKNGCALSGPDSTLWNTWGARKSTICDGLGNKKPAYASMTNLQIVNSFYTADGWTRNFQDSPDYREVWAQLVAIQRVAGNTGPTFAELDAWMKKIYVCSKLYTDQIYGFFTTPTVTCP